MNTVYRLNANELNIQFLESLKALFGDKEIEIIVTELDETAYLLAPQPNRSRLLQAIYNIEHGQNLVEAPADVLQ